MVQWAKPLNGTGEASQGRRLLAKQGEASETDEPKCLRVKKCVFGVCNFVDVVYLFLHDVVRHRLVTTIVKAYDDEESLRRASARYEKGGRARK